MKKTHPPNDWVFWTLVVLLTVFVFFSIRSFANAEPDTDAGILDSMIGYKVRDFEWNTDFIVTPSPTGGYIVRDPKNLWPIYKVEKGNIYNFKRERQPVWTVKDAKGKAVPK